MKINLKNDAGILKIVAVDYNWLTSVFLPALTLTVR